MHRLTPEEFWKERTELRLKVFVWGGAAVCALIALLTLAAMGVLGLLDSAFMIGLAYGIAFRRSRACAFIAALYYAVNQLMARMWGYGLTNAGSMFIVYLFLALMILSIYGTFTWQADYRAYLLSQNAMDGEDTGHDNL